MYELKKEMLWTVFKLFGEFAAISDHLKTQIHHNSAQHVSENPWKRASLLSFPSNTIIPQV